MDLVYSNYYSYGSPLAKLTIAIKLEKLNTRYYIEIVYCRNGF